MNLKHASFFTMLIMGLFLMSCEEDTDLTPDPDEKQGMFELEITDAPVDDPAVKSVFVTISDVQIDDQSLPDFSPVTVDLLTLRNGNTSVLGSDSINVGTYNEIALILDTSDCYIEDVDGNRHQLVAEVEKLEVPYEFSVTEDSAVSLVVDFDLRKTIRRDLNDSIDRYEFAPASDLVNGLRIINKDEAGQLMGQITDLTGQSDMIVAYVYEKGDFDASTEAEVGEDEIQFSNAVTSTLVESDGSYHFAFLEEGEYEMHFASFDEDPVTEEVQLNGVLEVESSVQEEVLNITIEPSSTIEIDLSVTGLLPL
ncbi:MAG TPA: DUF4382 domain-containing protein [Sphingobacteriaceae bacterium]|nr:DUF4382 domain-containing protein [Sphingobacteriaceae bacterium]